MLARTYGQHTRPPENLTFDPAAIPKPSAPPPPQGPDQLKRLEEQLHERDEKLSTLLADKTAFDAELQQLRAEVAAARQANLAQPDTHDYSEAETRDFFIDLLLKEAGWALDRPHDQEYEVTGMVSPDGRGFVDYVLWGDDGKPLRLVEAKRTKRNPREGVMSRGSADKTIRRRGCSNSISLPAAGDESNPLSALGCWRSAYSQALDDSVRDGSARRIHVQLVENDARPLA